MDTAKVWTLAALALFQAGCAETSSQSGRPGAMALSPVTAPGVAPGADAIVPNGNSCAPDAQEPAWGPGNVILGYRCIRANANGG